MGQPIEIFCCAAEADQSFLGQLSTQLALQQQQGLITLWDESQIPVGAMADQEIQRHLASARIFLLLISPDFLANDYCYNKVMKAALERHGRGEAITIPVIVRPAIWQDHRILRHIQVLPRNGQPVSGQRDRDYALWEVAKEVCVAAQRLREPIVQPHPELRHGPYGAMSSPQIESGQNTGTFSLGLLPFMGYLPVTKVDKISSLPANTQKKTGILLVLAVAIIILAGGTTFALYTKDFSNTVRGNTSYLTATQISSTSSVTPPTIAPTSPPTVSLSSPKLPLTISCISCAYPQLTLILTSITVDSVGQTTNWVFSISNTGRSSCSHLSFTTLRLTDPYGVSYQGKGQAADSFALGTQQSLQVNAVFALLPTARTQYTLKMDIYVGYCDLSTYSVSNPYQTVNFTFV